jgi:hypothetical protein
MMVRFRNVIRKRKWIFIAGIVVILIVADLLIAWYTVSYTIEDKAAEIQITSFNILEVQQSYSDTLLILSDDGVRLSSPSGFMKYDLSTNVTGACIADMTDAVAITTQDGVIHYYQPGQTTPHFSVNLNGSIRLIGITEGYASRGYVPEQVVLLSSNSTSTSVVVLSISTDGGVEWTKDLGSLVVATARSESTHHFAMALENNSLYMFRRSVSTPTRIYHVGERVREIVLTNTGLRLAVLSGHDPTRLSVYRSDSIQTILEKDLPGNCTDLKLQKQIESIFVRSGNDILEVSNEGVSVKVSKDDLTSYTAPTAVSSIFVSTKESILAYRGGRSSPIWEAKVGDVCTNVITDFGASVVVGYDSNHLLVIDNTDIILGSKIGWFIVGLAAIGESIALMIAFNWKRIQNAKKITLYVLVAGAFVGIAVSAVFISEDSASIFGGTTGYLVYVGILGAITALIAWSSEAGIASFVLGVGVALIISVPIALVLQFALWYSGYVFPMTDPVFKSVIIGLVEGIKMGIVGSITGYAIRRFYD